ncbi:glycosyltransferase family 2 protein [Opitutus terrae]|uniref:Glycosyl transferase family 2 n=1 Tax=Opitutus terrae (strain DSM 11246 / JCM 15787 / PB90-1) TaxID=452637 RepID=B1ZW32_OPITP|nr:glycosyltransferase [Opitutus terrae]ACB76046.1 glycosyl transferase family 2 [Opitutus terrae PB90-1]
MKASIIIATHNPRTDYLERVIAAIRRQTLPPGEWEFLLVDNCSSPPLASDLTNWHPHGRIIAAPMLGLTPARCAGLAASRGEILIWADDDNVLAPDYLEQALTAFAADAKLGAAGGKSIPEYESALPRWYHSGLAPLGCRDLGDERIDSRWTTMEPRFYPSSAPLGAGLVIRRSAMLAWAVAVEHDSRRARFGRHGAQLTSGEDNDINLTLLAAGWKLSYLPALRLIHLIPPRRLTAEYQGRIGESTSRDFVRVLDVHGIRPWRPIPRWGVPLRKARAWFNRRAWRGPAEHILWRGDCGQFDGRASIWNLQRARMLKAVGAGRAVYLLYHQPMGWVRGSWRDGGPLGRRRTERGRRAMMSAASTLPPPSATGSSPIDVTLLTGRQFWYQTAFCLWTLARTAERPVRPLIIDDGTTDETAIASLRRTFPQARFIPLAETMARLDEVLPVKRFPALRARRENFVLLRKLTDVHAGLHGWRLLLDSDLLFFRRPDVLLDWLDRPERPLRGEDVMNAYGYPLEELACLAGRTLPERVNTGTLGLRSDTIDWERLEHWCDALQRRGPHYFQEQALTAMLLAGADCVVLPPEDYVVFPHPPEVMECRAVMHHYTAGSKRWYFRHNWQRVFGS